MYALARFLQVAGLIIPLIAVFAQLGNRITPGQLLGFLVVAILLFSIGQLLQRYSSGGGS